MVEHEGSPTLVLAGPGTGKTTALACRIKHLIKHRSVTPTKILAVTFSTEATKEMINRLEEYQITGARVSTLHSEAHRILRKNSDKIGLPRNFFIADSDETLMLIKDAIEDLKLGGVWKLQMRRKIDLLKARNVSPDEAQVDENIKKLYKYYEELLFYNKAVDFSGLIMNAVRLLSQNRELLEGYTRQTQHLLVDEYQDMDPAQCEMIRLLAGSAINLFVVGDDDQSIYGWRGTSPDLLINFPNNFEGGQISDLDECWRLTEHILQGALGLISHNEKRCPKKICSKCGEGSFIKVLYSPSEKSEAEQIAKWVHKNCSNGLFEPGDIAIFFPSYGFEVKVVEKLRDMGIEVEYRKKGGIYGDPDFRKIIAHIRIFCNPCNNLALRQCLDSPTGQGIRDDGTRDLRRIAKRAQLPLWDVLTNVHKYKELKMWEDLYQKFVKYIVDLREKCKDPRKSVQIIADALRVSTSPAVDELKNIARLLPEGSNLQDFLKEIYKSRGLDITEGGAVERKKKNAVSIMSMHLAKGTEFNVVFLLGMENGILPNRERGERVIVEQRRICYVAMTRARKELIICWVKVRKGRHVRGFRRDGELSDFIKSEIPREHLRRLVV